MREYTHAVLLFLLSRQDQQKSLNVGGICMSVYWELTMGTRRIHADLSSRDVSLGLETSREPFLQVLVLVLDKQVLNPYTRLFGFNQSVNQEIINVAKIAISHYQVHETWPTNVNILLP